MKTYRITLSIAVAAFILAATSFLLNTGSPALGQAFGISDAAPDTLKFFYADGDHAWTNSMTPVLLKSCFVPAGQFNESIITMFDFGFNNCAITWNGGGEGRIILKVDGIAKRTLGGYSMNETHVASGVLRSYRADSCSVFTINDTSIDHTIELWGEIVGDSKQVSVFNNFFMVLGT